MKINLERVVKGEVGKVRAAAAAGAVVLPLMQLSRANVGLCSALSLCLYYENVETQISCLHCY
jgi:hypothetical protein